jgi:predicted anti-sigma-YlaC factor YlaD
MFVGTLFALVFGQDTKAREEKIMNPRWTDSWRRKYIPTGVLLLCLVSVSGCSVRKYAIDKVGDALAEGGSVYESDDDLELVGDALPFSLKLVESLLAESPRHKGLLQTAAKGFTTYSYVYVHNEADLLAVHDLAAAKKIRERAQRLYMRAHRYGIRGLEVDYPEFGEALFGDPAVAVRRIQNKEDVPLVYWTAAALGLAVSVSRNDASLLARLPEVDALVSRALELNEEWNGGALHEFRITLAGARPGEPDYESLGRSFHSGLELSRNTRASLFVTYAEGVSVPRQDRAQFLTLLEKALAIDPDKDSSNRLANLVAQRRARWLMKRIDELILPAETNGNEGVKP